MITGICLCARSALLSQKLSKRSSFVVCPVVSRTMFDVVGCSLTDENRSIIRPHIHTYMWLVWCFHCNITGISSTYLSNRERVGHSFERDRPSCQAPWPQPKPPPNSNTVPRCTVGVSDLLLLAFFCCCVCVCVFVRACVSHELDRQQFPATASPVWTTAIPTR